MKRAGRLMERIVLPDNLRESYLLVRRGKQRSHEVQRFGENLDEELERMGEEMLAGSYLFGRYHKFTIYDPKRRTICAAPFRDRVAMQAMMRVCHPIFDSYQIFDSYASRPGKGTYAAIARAQQFACKSEWFAMLDVRSFFYSISHEVMMRQLEHLIKDRMLLGYFGQLMDSYHVEEGRGLPIGNLTSQYFANHNLAEADHYAKEHGGVRRMVRYMDNTLFFADSRAELDRAVGLYSAYAAERLRLEMHEPVVNRCKAGVPFLGKVIHGHRLSLTQRSRSRFRCKLRSLRQDFEAGNIGEREYRERLTATYAFVEKADAAPFMKGVIEKEGFLP